MSEITYETAPAVSNSSAAAIPVIDRIWPIAVIAFGLGLTAAWVCLLGYGVVRLIRFAF
jgi:hypothetical protein